MQGNVVQLELQIRTSVQHDQLKDNLLSLWGEAEGTKFITKLKGIHDCYPNSKQIIARP